MAEQQPQVYDNDEQLDNNRGILTRLQETQWSAAQRTVQRIHRNLGHPTNLELAKLLKSKNASPSIVAAAQQHHYQLCDAHRPPPQVAKSTLLSLGGNEDIGRNLSQFNFVFSQSFDVWYLSECGHARTSGNVPVCSKLGTFNLLRGKRH